MKLEEGKIVWLKSGGPKMTVKFFHQASQKWRCTWFDSKQQIMEAFFEEAQLTDEDPNLGGAPLFPRKS